MCEVFFKEDFFLKCMCYKNLRILKSMCYKKYFDANYLKLENHLTS